MSIPVPTAPAVKAYLMTALAARTELTGSTPPAELSYDVPGTFLADDVVVVGDVDVSFAPLQMVGSGGAGWLDEHYTVDVVVDVVRGADDAQGAFQRAATLAAAAIDIVRQDPSLGGLVIQAAPSRLTFESNWQEDGKGRQTTAVLSIAVHARL